MKRSELHQIRKKSSNSKNSNNIPFILEIKLTTNKSPTLTRPFTHISGTTPQSDDGRVLRPPSGEVCGHPERKGAEKTSGDTG